MQTVRDRRALREGLIAVAAFATTLPLTVIALEGFPPLQLTFGRLMGASLFAICILWITHAPLPERHQFPGLLLVALGGVFGFPLLTAIALAGREAAPAAIPLALIPLETALWSRLRGHERPTPAFWLWAVAGSIVVLHFAWQSGASLAAPELFFAGVSASISYAEGGRLAREMPGWQVMAWALVSAAPMIALGFGYSWRSVNLPPTVQSWLALLLLALISQFGAFWFWYRALATGVSRTSQLQLLQPFFTLLLASILLGETIAPKHWLYAAATAVAVQLARTRRKRILQSVGEANP